MNLTQYPGVVILCKRTVSADKWVIHQNICGNCPPTENPHTRESEEIPLLYAVETTFGIIYLCLLFSTGLNFSIKYVSCVSYVSTPYLMYLQQTKLLPQIFAHEIELLAEKELLHNILPKFGACRLQLINLTFFHAFLIRSEVFKLLFFS